jgi:hypothetical protein
MRSAALESWSYTAPEGADKALSETLDKELVTQMLPLMIDRGKHRRPFDQTVLPRSGDRLWLAVVRDHRDAVVDWLGSLGWTETAKTGAENGNED